MQTDLESRTTVHRALVIGKNSLAQAVSDVLATRSIAVEHRDSLAGASDVQSVSLVFHAWFPDPYDDSPATLAMYPQQLLEHSVAMVDGLTAAHPTPAIIPFAFLPAIYVGTVLEDYTSALRGGITGVTRTLARKFGKRGLRVSCVQAGLMDMPETQAWVSDKVKQVVVPTKRWANAIEVAKFMVFLAADSTYTTGQTMIIDGGLTAGITGT
jgi:hypothetical protein